MNNQPRVNPGTPEGGEFAAHSRGEADVTLSPTHAPSAMSRFEVLSRAVRGVEMQAIAADIKARTLQLFPTATAVKLQRGAFGEWAFDHVVSGDLQLTAPGGKFFSDDPKVYAIDEFAEPLIRRFGATDDPITFGEVSEDLVLNFDAELSEELAPQRTDETETGYQILRDADSQFYHKYIRAVQSNREAH